MPAPGATDVLGGVGGGWAAAMTVLGFERGSQITTAAIEFRAQAGPASDNGHRTRQNTDPLVRDGLAWCYSRVQILRYQGYRGLTRLLNGQPPGVEAGVNKVLWASTSAGTPNSPLDPGTRRAVHRRAGQRQCAHHAGGGT